MGMLPKVNKLTRDSFPKYTDPKKIWLGVSLRIQYSYSNSTQKPRFAVVVSKKVLAKAVDRNKLKRSVFSIIEGSGSTLLTKGGMKIVIFPLKKDFPITIQKIEEDMRSFIAQLR